MLTKDIKGLSPLCILCVLNLLTNETGGQRREIKIHVNEKTAVTFQWYNDLESPTAYVWESQNQTVAEYISREKKLSNVRQQSKGRISISPTDGALTISDVSREDSGIYKCVAFSGARNEPDVLHELIVNVPPDDFQLLCSGKTENDPDENCQSIKQEAIKSIKCYATSYPETSLMWYSVPSECDKLEYVSDSHQVGYVFKQSVTLKSLCDGEYCCQSNYPNMKTPEEKCHTVGHKSHKGLIIGLCITGAVILVTLILLCVIIVRCKNKMPCWMQEDHHTKRHPEENLPLNENDPPVEQLETKPPNKRETPHADEHETSRPRTKSVSFEGVPDVIPKNTVIPQSTTQTTTEHIDTKRSLSSTSSEEDDNSKFVTTKPPRLLKQKKTIEDGEGSDDKTSSSDSESIGTTDMPRDRNKFVTAKTDRCIDPSRRNKDSDFKSENMTESDEFMHKSSSSDDDADFKTVKPHRYINPK